MINKEEYFMKGKLFTGVGILLLVVTSCVQGPAITQQISTNSNAGSSTSQSTTLLYPMDTPSSTADPCTVYVASVTSLFTQFETDLVKVKSDVQIQDWDALSWDWSQILNFALSNVEALEPPSQMVGFNQGFLLEIQAYDDGALAYLHADPATGAAKFLEGDALRSTQVGSISQLSCP
jgi:hypothetical protein